MTSKKEIFGHYRGFAGLYWIKAIRRNDGKYDVYARQYSPSLQIGWSYWGVKTFKEIREMCYYLE